VVWKVLNAQHQQYPITCLINGGCHGADQLARNWAKKFGVTQETYPADWSKGRIAGPIRNQEMIDRGKPDLVIAFPGGKGTADMVRRAREAGIPVQEVEQ
jgi:ABC-type sugar transport system substrate-binding protein